MAVELERKKVLNSSYLNERKKQIQNETETEIRQIEADVFNKRSAIKKSKEKYRWAIIVVTFFIAVRIFNKSYIMWFLIPLVVMLMREGNYKIKESNYEEERKLRIANAIANGQEKLESEELDYENTAKIKCNEYIQHYNDPRLRTSINIITEYLENNFSSSIRNADHSEFIKYITVIFEFNVETSNIKIHTWQIVDTPNAPGTKYNNKEEIFNFFKNSINDVPNIMNQIGLSRALAWILKQRMIKRFPWDPSDQLSKYPSKIELNANDSCMTLTYIAPNGKYKIRQSV